MKLGPNSSTSNENLSDENREMLKETAFSIFVEQPHRDYVKKLLATSNLKNVYQVYQGYHSLPTPYHNGFEIKMSNVNGTITTPMYHGEFEDEYYKKNHDCHMVLELPDNIIDQVGDGSLLIDLEADIREEKGWHEKVEYSIIYA